MTAMSREQLRDALAVWRATRAEVIAEIIDRITAQLTLGWQPPAPKLARTFQAAWLAAAADDVARGWAARHVLDKLPDRTAAVRERLSALVAAGPDPRVGRELRGQLDKLPAGLEALVAQLDLQVPPVRAPTEAELARFAPPVRTADLEALERDVYANPDDDEPRAVLADLLQSRGDPRGELIALQLAAAAGRGTDEGDARIAELVRDHGRGWLGPLNQLAARAEFQRGFVTRLELAAGQPTRDLLEDPLLGTVEELLPGEATSERYAELITSPAMRALRRIEIADATVLRALAQTHAELVHVACPHVLDGLWAACARIATLRSVACPLAAVPELMRSPLGSRLTSVTVSGEITAALAFWRTFRRPIELVIAPHARLAGCALADVDGEGSIHARREADRVIMRVAGPWGATAISDGSLLPVDRLELVEPIRIAQLAGKVEIARIPREGRAGIIQAIHGPL
jgi:uncharacterized protein (TIGR02996 family)